mgnify:CR=1 FL=1
MKSYEEFTNDDLQQFLAENDFIRPSKRGAYEPAVIDYDKLSDMLGIKPRQARNLVSGKLPLQKGHYNLLALHAGLMEPQLIAAQKSEGEDRHAGSIAVLTPVEPPQLA